MFLKRIEVQGFKSFAYFTKINFKDGLTVIVGPNGSGKSNINDAIKWVLGETSKKTLRATSAKDMIFAGSDDEKPADFAEVSLIFSNDQKILNIDLKEVQITRRSYRNQDKNEYFINKELIRRKDIKNLFLDTGLGNTDLSIISQGSVTKIMEAKPDDLKQLLEEAAGVSRYKTQKIDSFKALEQTTQKLNIFYIKLSEMEKQIKPLKKQTIKATQFLKIKEELKNIELPLIKKQLTDATKENEQAKNILQETEIRKNYLDEQNKTLSIKNKKSQEEILRLEKILYSLQTKQNELTHANSFSTSSKNTLEKEITDIVKNIKDIKMIIDDNQKIILNLERDIQFKEKITEELKLSQSKIFQQLQTVKYNLLENRKHKSKYNYATNKILENKSIFNIVYGTVVELIEYESKYDIAIQVALGNKLKNIIVNNQETIKETINFLKKYKYGTSTFIPAEQVQPNSLKLNYQEAFKNLKGYVGPLSTVIKSKSQFKNVISSLAGNILLFDNLDLALRAAKQSGYKFTIVTLEGDVIYPGLTIKGGSQDTPISRINDELTIQKKEILLKIDQINKNYENAKNKFHDKKDQFFALTKSNVRLEERSTYLESNLHKLLEQYKTSFGVEFDLNEIKGVSSMDNYSFEQLNSDIQSLQDQKSQCTKETINYQAQLENFRKEWEQVVTKNGNNKIILEKTNTEIDNNLIILNRDYKLTWDALQKLDFSEISIEEITINFSLCAELRGEIDKLGFINIEAINDLKERVVAFEKLSVQTEDLELSKAKLLSTINEMDEKMKDKFVNTFDKVNLKLQEVFTQILGGGHAKLNYLDPENKLESGLFIEAMTPGKKVQNINLYSGGERSMIALSLIFAINEVNQLPLLLLDEVEAALDEANVDRFSSFAKDLNKKTQLIITTHRPGTMEKADILYGVTMQKKGITKIVSVELQDAIELAEEE